MCMDVGIMKGLSLAKSFFNIKKLFSTEADDTWHFWMRWYWLEAMSFQDNVTIFLILAMVEAWAQRVDSEGDGLPKRVNKNLKWILFAL